MRNHLGRLGDKVNRKCVQRLMRQMGLKAIYPKPKTSKPDPEHKIYPYLLRNLTIDRPNQVWATDITDIPMERGFMYLVAVMDWHSRKVPSWRVSNTMKSDFCVDGKGRYQDNIFIERLWWTLKYHYIYLRTFQNGAELRSGLKTWFTYYNQERFHQSLNNWTPDEIYFKKQSMDLAA